MRLSHHYVVPHVSTGDMLRAAVKQGTAIGLKAKDLMDQGELLGDDLIMEMVAERLGESDVRARGFILDGCPRTVSQAEQLAVGPGPLRPGPGHRHRGPHRPGAPPPGRPAGVHRLRGQLLALVPPLINWTCDVCGGEVVQREDDTEEAIERRLELYERQTAPLIEWYRDRNQLESVPGTGTPDAVTRRMVKVIELRRGKKGGWPT